MAPSPSLNVSSQTLERALIAMGKVVGTENVFHSEEDRAAYSDHFAADESLHAPTAAIAVKTVEEIQAIVRLANEYKVPLWTIGRGRNFGYGGPAPVLKGSITLDMSRMKNIEFDEENGTALVEPGVSFYDFYDYVTSRKLPYWLSVPGNSWGSVVGNALERGVGYTPYGDHGDRICGLEVVLPNGDIVRTGMGAMSHSTTWQSYKPGFGPSWDAMFCQSNFGIVTKMGLWLMPEPESMLGFDMEFDKPEDLGWIVDAVAPLRRAGIIQHAPSIGNWMRTAAVRSVRQQWTDKPGMLDDAAISAIRKAFDIGYWGIQVRFYGPLAITEASARMYEDAFKGKAVLSSKRTRWTRDDGPPTNSFAGVPTTVPLANSNWHGGRGGHAGFSPVMALSGKAAMDHFQRTKVRYDEFGLDYQAMFSLNERSIFGINQVFYDKDDPEMMATTKKLLQTMLDDAAKVGLGEYRTHIEEMDHVADTFDFNNHALKRLNETLKDSLDPNGILSPGKSGIWPAAYRRA